MTLVDHPVIGPDGDDATDENHDEPRREQHPRRHVLDTVCPAPGPACAKSIVLRPQRVAPALRGVCLASSVSRQAPLPAPAAALACSHLSRARSAGARSARLYQRRAAVARAAATVARPASP